MIHHWYDYWYGGGGGKETGAKTILGCCSRWHGSTFQAYSRVATSTTLEMPVVSLHDQCLRFQYVLTKKSIEWVLAMIQSSILKLWGLWLFCCKAEFLIFCQYLHGFILEQQLRTMTHCIKADSFMCGMTVYQGRDGSIQYLLLRHSCAGVKLGESQQL